MVCQLNRRDDRAVLWRDVLSPYLHSSARVGSEVSHRPDVTIERGRDYALRISRDRTRVTSAGRNDPQTAASLARRDARHERDRLSVAKPRGIAHLRVRQWSEPKLARQAGSDIKQHNRTHSAGNRR